MGQNFSVVEGNINSNVQHIWDTLCEVQDPEVPALSVVDLGIIRNIKILEDRSVIVDVTPTYTGCPATQLINSFIRIAIEASGYEDVNIKTVLSPPWTTEWISDEGRQKLKEYGIAPPVGKPEKRGALFGVAAEVNCPRCQSEKTERISEFGSTACKALYKCGSCLEPFEYFKCL